MQNEGARSDSTRIGERKREPFPRWADQRKGHLKLLRDLCNPRPWQPDPTEELSVPSQLEAPSAQFLLEEAEGVFAERRDQALRAEARATTLQAAAGIAIGLALTGAAFLVDPMKVSDRYWRLGLTVVFAALLLCLGMAGYLANQATAKLLTYARISPSSVLLRAGMAHEEACRDRAAMLLVSARENLYFSVYKIKQVKVAGLWFRGALACFATLSVVLSFYVALGPVPRTAVGGRTVVYRTAMPIP